MILVVKSLQSTHRLMCLTRLYHIYLDNRSLGLSYMEQVAAQKVGESGTNYFRQAVWSALMISESAKSRALVPYVPSCPEINIACPRALVP